MRDFNFFSSHIKHKETEKKRVYTLLAIAIIVVLIIGGSYGVTHLIAWRLSSSTDEMKCYLASEEVSQKVKQVEQKKQQITIINEYNNLVDALNADYEKVDIIKTKLMEDINKTLPQNVVIKNISFDQSNISISASSSSRPEIAELQHNLKEMGIFNNVSVGSIQASDASRKYEFNISCGLKGVKD